MNASAAISPKSTATDAAVVRRSCWRIIIASAVLAITKRCERKFGCSAQFRILECRRGLFEPGDRCLSADRREAAESGDPVARNRALNSFLDVGGSRAGQAARGRGPASPSSRSLMAAKSLRRVSASSVSSALGGPMRRLRSSGLGARRRCTNCVRRSSAPTAQLAGARDAPSTSLTESPRGGPCPAHLLDH